jgi:hypothetical protein
MSRSSNDLTKRVPKKCFSLCDRSVVLTFGWFEIRLNHHDVPDLWAPTPTKSGGPVVHPLGSPCSHITPTGRCRDAEPENCGGRVALATRPHPGGRPCRGSGQQGVARVRGSLGDFDGILSGEHRGDGVAMAPAEQVAAREPGTRCAICGSP